MGPKSKDATVAVPAAPAAPAAPPVKAAGAKAAADKVTGKRRGGASRMNVLAEAAAAPPGVAAPPEPPAAPAVAAAPGGQSMLPEVDILVNLQRNGNGSAPAAVQAPKYVSVRSNTHKHKQPTRDQRGKAPARATGWIRKAGYGGARRGL